MGIVSLYESGDRKQDKGHFRNMVLIARADGVIDDRERDLLNKIGRGIGLTEDEIVSIMRNPMDYPINPPANKVERYEQIINLVQMAQVDGEIHPKEMDVIEHVIIELGFNSVDDVDIESIVAMVVRGEDTDIIIDEVL